MNIMQDPMGSSGSGGGAGATGATGATGAANKVATIVFTGGGASLTPKWSDNFDKIPANLTIVKSTIFVMHDDIASNASIEIYVADPTFTTFTKISASAPPTLTAARLATDSTLTGWTTALTAGNFLGAKLLPGFSSSLKSVTVVLEFT